MSETERARILVVDDEDIVCVSVRRILEREGCAVDAALTAEAALKALDGKPFDLVITDLMMPEMNGIELMHTIRARGHQVPFVMITGYPTIRTAMQALRLGAVDYIPKPFTRQELLSPVNRALRRQSNETEPPAQPRPGSSEPANPGDRFVLPEHSWAVYNQDGTVSIGVESSFLSGAGKIITIETPGVNEMIEQGYPTIRLHTADGGQHGVFAPFSGRVTAINLEAVSDPAKLNANLWLLQIIPANLQAETVMLVKRQK